MITTKTSNRHSTTTNTTRNRIQTLHKTHTPSNTSTTIKICRCMSCLFMHTDEPGFPLDDVAVAQHALDVNVRELIVQVQQLRAVRCL